MNAAQRRFWKQVEFRAGPLPTACLVWTGALDSDGYGSVSIKGRTRKTHQLVWEWARGPIPERMVPDHLCKNRACCREEHLELVTVRENTLRGDGPTALNARKTHCPHGHPYDEENTILRTDPDGQERRVCRTCERERRRTPEGGAPVDESRDPAHLERGADTQQRGEATT